MGVPSHILRPFSRQFINTTSAGDVGIRARQFESHVHVLTLDLEYIAETKFQNRNLRRISPA